MEYIVLNWEDCYAASHLLFEKIFLDDYRPEIIIAIARGGWIPGRLMADFFRTKKTANIKVDAYHEINATEVNPIITQRMSESIKGMKVILIDDIADSGKSLKVVLDEIYKLDVGEVRTATIHYKSKSIIKPDYYIEETEAWVIYPWEYYETIQDFVHRFKENKLNNKEIRIKLLEIGIPVNMIDSYLLHYPDS